MSEEPTTIFGLGNRMVQQELDRLAREKAEEVRVGATWERDGTLQASASATKAIGRGWWARVWGGWRRKPGPDDVGVGAELRKDL